jgi:hypothetical protein
MPMADEDLTPLVYDEHGTASFDFARAIRLHDQEQKEWATAAEDLARLGMAATPGAMSVQPPQGKGVGDIHTQVTSPGERYWDRYRQGRAESLIKPVAKMPTPPPIPDDAKKYLPMVQTYIDKLCECINSLKCSPLTMQPHPHLAPQVSAINVDVFNGAVGKEITGAYPGPGPCVDILTINVPDRFIVVLDRFGNELEDHNAFGDVRFSMKRNRTPIRSYVNFDVQLGEFIDPTRFSSPIILKHKDVWKLQGQSVSGATHFAFARITGWAFAVTEITGDGSYKEFCTK